MPLAEPRNGTSVGFHIYNRVMDEGTLGDPEAIIWSSIRHLCSREVAEDIAAFTHGVRKKRDRQAIGRNLKLYVQQASAFYEVARSAKPNTAPLIYYYSFLNLAKALCELRHPQFHERPECYKHGVSWTPDRRKYADPTKETVSITTRGIWHSLWEALMARPCPAVNPTKLRVKAMFSYCPEISVESTQTLQTSLDLISIEKPDVLYDEKASEAWTRFSVYRFDLKRLRVSVPNLKAQIRTPRSGYIEVKSIDRSVRTLQSATPKVLSGRDQPLEEIMPDIAAINTFAYLGRERQLEYFIPVQIRLPFPLPQLVVNYTILFWLGSLVRYDPHSVNALMDSRYWMLIDGFMSQSRLWLLELFEWALYKAETTLWISR
jgi:hypothetical protein